MRQKLITLDAQSFDIASRMGNFSAFVRRATKATEEGGLELVEPTQMLSTQMLSMLLARNQTEHGFKHPVNDVLISLISHFRTVD
jgi:hypothetical protein